MNEKRFAELAEKYGKKLKELCEEALADGFGDFSLAEGEIYICSPYAEEPFLSGAIRIGGVDRLWNHEKAGSFLPRI